MGLLKVGKPLKWEESKRHSAYVREHGVRQFVATYYRVKDIAHDRLLYGDEVEHALVKVDDERRRAQISLRGPEVMEELRAREQECCRGATWHQEYGSWMLESTPSTPYVAYTLSLVQVEKNMRLRRARLVSVLPPGEIAPTMVNFPMMGTEDFVDPPGSPGGPASLSDSVPDACINPHPRFSTLTGNIRSRRGAKVDIRVPLFRDVNTPEFAAVADGAPEPYIHMDCMAYGMGMCCLQVTFQAADVDESRVLYDQLAVLAPIMMALTAGTPIFRGRLAGTDARWGALSASVDDRTPAERGEPAAGASSGGPGAHAADPEMVGGGVTRQSKSRYDSISTYISAAAHKTESLSAYYNDISCETDEGVRQHLLAAENIDEPLARHIAHLFTRDPLVVFEGAVEEVDDATSTEHFESIQSTNWQTMRWKPPPPPKCGAPHIGWRTEFRSMEVQLTDFENAAFTAFVVLVSRAVLVFDLDLLVPLSKVDDNMRRAHTPAAAVAEKFWFRMHLCGQTTDVEEMSMDEIMNGKGSYFPGLLPLCYTYLEHINCDSISLRRIDEYLSLVRKRATGELLTPATWMRQFVQEHPEYKQDSVITQGIAYDMVKACNDIGLGRRACPELHGDVVIEPIVSEGIYATPLDSLRLGAKERCDLLSRFRARAAAVDGPLSTPTATAARTRSRTSSFSKGAAGA